MKSASSKKAEVRMADAKPLKTLVQGYGLTPLWEQVTRTGRLPDGTDVGLVFGEMSARLRHGEWEVRQHALRVLSDVVPVLGHQRLELCLPSVLSELITNLGHPSAAVRRAASNTLRACIRESDAPDGVLRTVIARANSDDRNVALGVVVHLPSLLDDRVSMQTMSIMIGTVAKKLIQISFQEHALRSLVKMRQTIGERDFNHILAKCNPQCLQDFSILCQVYEVSDYLSTPLDQPLPLGFLSEEAEPDEGGPSGRERRSKSPSPTRRPSTASRPTSSGRSSSVGAAKSRTASAASSSFSQPSSDLEDDDGLFIRGKSAGQGSRVGTGRRVRFGGESELKTPSPVIRFVDQGRDKENVSPERQQPVRTASTSHIPVRIKTENGPQVTPVRPRSRSHDLALRAHNEAQERPEITVSSPPIEKRRESVSSPVKLVQRSASPVKERSPSPPKKVDSPVKKVSPRKRRNSTKGVRGIPNMDGGESLTASSSDYEREEAAKMNSVLPAEVEVPRVASALASLEQFEKKAEDASWEDLSIVDKSVMEDLRDREDWRARVRGAQQLKAALRNSGAVERLRSHLPEFLTFLDSMLEDHSPLVVSATLGTFARLAEALGPHLGPHVRHVCGALCRPAASNRAEVKMEAAHASKALMQALGPQRVMMALADNLAARNHRHREAALQLLILALLTFPSSDFDAAEIANKVLPSLADTKRRVRQGALECVAVLGQFVHPSALPVHLAAQKLRSKQSLEALHAAVNERLARKILPVLSSEGLILYSVQVSNAAARGLSGSPFGADVEWILAGSGSTSAGSARSRGQLFSAARRGSSEDSLPEDRPLSTPAPRLKSGKGSRSPLSRRRASKQLPSSPIKEYQSFQTQPPPPPSSSQQNSQQQSNSSQDETWELVPVAALQDDENNSRLPTEGPLWTAEIATNPNQSADGENKMYLRLLRRQPEQLVNLDKERGYILLPSKRLASALSRTDVRSDTPQKPPSPAFPHLAPTQESRGDSEEEEERRPAASRSSSLGNWSASRDRHRVSPLPRASPPSTPSSSDNGYGSPYHRTARSRARRDRSPAPPSPFNSKSTPKSPIRDEELRRSPLRNVSPHHKQMQVNINNNNAVHSAPAVLYPITDDEPDATLVPRAEINVDTTSVRSERSSAGGAGRSIRSSRDSALASSINSVNTPPAAPHYFDPFDTPLPYPTKTLTGPYFSNSAFATPPEAARSSPRPDTRPRSPPIRPHTVSPIPLNEQAGQPQSLMEDVLRNNPMERPLPVKSECPPEAAPAPAATVAVPAVPKSRVPRSVSNVRRGAKSSSLNRAGVRTGSAQSSSSSLMDEAPQVPIRKPHEALNQCLSQMGSQDWTTVNKGLKTLSNLVQLHPDVVTSDMHSVVHSLVAQIKNLRSQVSRTACQVAGEMAQHLKRALDCECEDLVAPLLLRSADTNKFLRKDCNDALDKMMQNIPPTKTIPALISQGAGHKNAIVRTTTSRLLCEQVQRMGADKVMSALSKDARVKLLRTSANFLTEGSQETRDWSKRLMQTLVAHELFESYLEQAVSANTLRTIDKTLKVLVASRQTTDKKK